ncbi:MAG: SDR family NAD(P)-dependent oxidoreductase [Alphaproteobacteria bacterium]|nr:SDR family NAD(P)-dependent oxidoreductase [Alphaproteobacteria bacterium]
MSTENPGTCIIVGVGPGLGASLARRFAAGGHAVAVAARNVDKLADIVGQITGGGGTAKAYACDSTSETDVAALFAAAEGDLGAMDVGIYNASGRARGPIADTTVSEFTDAWERCCLGGFLVGREAARRLGPKGAGSILFTGATASMKGFPHSSTFAAGKFALRGLAESMAREMHPKGVHVAHFNIDGGIGVDGEGEARLRPDAIAETYFQTHLQHPSAWSHSIEVRPWVEKF